jgi:hypothetical protein
VYLNKKKHLYCRINKTRFNGDSHALNFKYIKDTHIDDNNDKIIVPRPRVEIRLHNGDGTFKIAMLIDSGADITLLPLEVAEILNLKLSDPIKSRSASGKFETRKGKVSADLLKGRNVYPLGEMSAPFFSTKS